RSVILEEISMYLDSPEDAIQDEFDEILYPGHPLGTNILGTRESMNAFSRDDLMGFVNENVDTHRIILSVVGNVSFRKAIKLAEKFLGVIPEISQTSRRLPAPIYSPASKVIEKPISQAHVALGLPAYSLHPEKRFQYFTLIHLLGGPGMNS